MHNSVFDTWKDMLRRYQEDNDYESFELQDLHEQIGAHLIEYLEELEGELG
jgi:hypothetical protein